MALDQQGSGSITLVTPSSSQGGGQLPSPSLTKRRLLSGPSHNRDSKTRKRDDGGSKRYGGSIAELGRDGRKDEFVDCEFMDRLKAGKPQRQREDRYKQFSEICSYKLISTYRVRRSF